MPVDCYAGAAPEARLKPASTSSAASLSRVVRCGENHSLTGSSSAIASADRSGPSRRARLVAVRSSNDFVPCFCAMSRDWRYNASAAAEFPVSATPCSRPHRYGRFSLRTEGPGICFYRARTIHKNRQARAPGHMPNHDWLGISSIVVIRKPIQEPTCVVW